MTVTVPNSPSKPPAVRSVAERILHWGFIRLTLLAAGSVVVLLVAIALMIAYEAWPALQTYGLSFLTTTTWNPVIGREQYGALALIWGTVASAAIALMLAIPLGLGTAIFLSEDLLPRPVRSLMGFFVELLAAIPSVVYGLWGIVVLIPTIQPLANALHQHLGWIPLFSTAPIGPGLFPASLVLAIMILPMIAAIARDSLLALPLDLRMAAFSVGATRWEAIAQIFLPAASSGIIGGILLALGRALGETMAVTMLIGNVNQISLSLFAPTNTIASLLASQFAAAKELQISALMYAALLLMAIALLVNILAELIIHPVKR